MTPAQKQAYIEAREALHANIEAQVQEMAKRHKGCPLVIRSMRGVYFQERRRVRLLLWSYFAAVEPPSTRLRKVDLTGFEGDNQTRTQ